MNCFSWFNLAIFFFIHQSMFYHFSYQSEDNCLFHGYFHYLYLMNKNSLLSTDQVSQQTSSIKNVNERSKRRIGIALIVLIILASILIGVLSIGKAMQSLRVPLPYSPFPILLGNSRVIQILFYSGFDNRTLTDYKTVTQREIIWSTDKSGIVSVDSYGRLQTLSLGKVVITAKSKSSPNVFAEFSIEVVTKMANYKEIQKRIVNYEGTPAALNKVLQKIVTYKTKDEALISKDVPNKIKDIIKNPKIIPNKEVAQENDVFWKIEDYADGSNRSFVKRIGVNEVNKQNRIMYFIGDQYLPGSGFQVLSIEDDGEKGIWTVNSVGQVSHIEMKEISYRQKAEIMVENTQKYVLRHGQASFAQLKNGTWVPGFDDNDGLWTSMYAAGEFMRLGSLRNRKYPEQEISKARSSALYSLKSILLIANVACRNKTIDAKLRHFINTRAGQGQSLGKDFLLKGKPFAVDEYVGSAIDGSGLFGVDAGKTVDQNFYGGNYQYSFLPIHTSDWSNNSKDQAATSKRTLNGYIARSFVIQPLDGTPPDGLFFRHNKNGTQYVIHQADTLYDYGVDDHPNLDLGNMELPSILKEFLNIKGIQYQKTDLLYKGDTSTDQIIGHLFIYKIAYDILDQADPEQNTLKQLIKSTLINFCTLLINNGYSMVDATGQGTTWGKITRTFLISDFCLQDAPLKALEILMAFKMCYYVTGDESWRVEYQFLIEDQSFKYLQLVASVWERWKYRAFNQDVFSNSNYFHLNSNYNYTNVEVERHIIDSIHYSDQEQAFLAFYLAFQLEEKEEYLVQYRQALQGWWHSPSRSQNHLWYYIYQLAYPQHPKKDYFNNNLLQISSWQLSRHIIDTRRTSAFVQGSRSDVIIQGQQRVTTIFIDPNHILQRRQFQKDAKFCQRAINYRINKDYDPMNIYQFKILPSDQRKILRFNSPTFQSIFDSSSDIMFPSTSYTLPYWMGIYHNMLTLE